jgi:hypothetical protein
LSPSDIGRLLLAAGGLPRADPLIGLALVSSIASVHNGTVHATADPTGGLDITVRLPRRHHQNQDDRARTENT